MGRGRLDSGFEVARLGDFVCPGPVVYRRAYYLCCPQPERGLSCSLAVLSYEDVASSKAGLPAMTELAARSRLVVGVSNQAGARASLLGSERCEAPRS